MKIEREGKTIELTKQELYEAHEEYEREMSIAIIKPRLTEHLSDDEYEKLKDNEEFLFDVACEYERLREYDCDQDYSVCEAINEYKGRYL